MSPQSLVGNATTLMRARALLPVLLCVWLAPPPLVLVALTMPGPCDASGLASSAGHANTGVGPRKVHADGAARRQRRPVRVQHAGPADSRLRELGHTPLGDVG